MKIQQYGPEMEELKRKGMSYQQIAEQIGLSKKQVSNYFTRNNPKRRKDGYRRSRKNDALKTNQALRKELQSLRMEVELLRDFLGAIERK